MSPLFPLAIRTLTLSPQGETPLAYTLIRRKRRTIEIRVLPCRSVRVTAPLWMPFGTIENFIRRKMSWLRQKLAEPAPQTRRFEPGETLYFLGEPYVLEFRPGAKPEVGSRYDARTYLTVTAPEARWSDSAYIRRLVREWYRDRAISVIGAQVWICQERLGLHPKMVRFKWLKSRWGSCSGKKAVNFNIQLVCMPLSVIEYVVIHELCHLKHLNHSRSFWRLVAEYAPDYRDAVRFLRLNQQGYSV